MAVQILGVVPVFPQLAKGKPLLALTDGELEVAIGDAELAYVFESGMDRDLSFSDKLQMIRKLRKLYRISIDRSRLIVHKDAWYFPGPLRAKEYGIGWSGYAYICVLPNNQLIKTSYSSNNNLRFGPVVHFLQPVTGWYVEVSGESYELTNEGVELLSFNNEMEYKCAERNVPFGTFDDLY